MSPPPSHWRLAADVISFQFKLVLDGLRDVLLSPISIGAALLGVLTDAGNPGKYFYELMRLGRRTDRWINLFNAHQSEQDEVFSADDVFRRAEDMIRSEYERGGVVKNLKDGADEALSGLRQDLKQDLKKCTGDALFGVRKGDARKQYFGRGPDNTEPENKESGNKEP